MSSKIKVLIVVAGMNRGGLENYIMNLYRAIERSEVQFDFLINSSEETTFDKEILSLGGNIFRVPHITAIGHFKYKRRLKDFFHSHKEYKIVYSHMNAVSGLVLNAAKKENIPVRIAHSHSTRFGKNLVEKTYKKLISLYIRKDATHFFACSKIAGEKLFGKRIAKGSMRIVNNGVSLKEFAFSQDYRIALRNELGIDSSTWVIGHVGRFQYMKNHGFIIDVCKRIMENGVKAKLLLIGDGELKYQMQAKAEELGISESIMFLGLRSDVPMLLNAMDVFILPSLFEGFPVTLVEAQANGLRSVVSDTITREVDLGLGLVKFSSLGQTTEYWAKELVHEYERCRIPDKKKLKDFDIGVIATDLQELFRNCYSE